MEFTDQLLAAFPGTTITTGETVFHVGSTDDHNRPQFVVESGFIELFYRGEFTHCRTLFFAYHREERYKLASLAYHLPPFQIVRSYEDFLRTFYLVRGESWWAALEVGDGFINASFGALTAFTAEELGQRFRAGLETKLPPKQITNFEVWSGDEFPTSHSFTDVLWSDVAVNYADVTRRGLDSLMKHTRSSVTKNGRIILFHGPPGTGKTWAIRSLLTKWKHWTKPNVIIDPEKMLENTGYFMNMLNYQNADEMRLLVIEDADDIAEKNGTRNAGLSRLLNAADGLVGASSDVLILLSTNAPPALLDKALVRPGRCLASIEFMPFSAGDASSRLGWTVDSAKTLAEIYELLGTVSKVSASGAPSSTGHYL
jgi:hypothetical protein